jgi:hypothetical protein
MLKEPPRNLFSECPVERGMQYIVAMRCCKYKQKARVKSMATKIVYPAGFRFGQKLTPASLFYFSPACTPKNSARKVRCLDFRVDEGRALQLCLFERRALQPRAIERPL